MDPTVITAIFSGLALLITTVIAGYVSVINSRVKKTEEHVATTLETVEKVKVQTDGMSSRLAAASLAQGLAEGEAKGIEKATKQNGTPIVDVMG